MLFIRHRWAINSGLPIDGHQRLELLITATQSLFAVSILIDRRITAKGAISLFALFGPQFAASILLAPDINRVVILVMSGVYVVLAVGLVVARRHVVVRCVRDGIVTPFTELKR
nr:hypothetical protein [Kibdelosporangium sp. MJ126-NF4]CEL17603.1 sodium/calcium exchanger family protein [Kibdelosporangium sp. MJ126-NF4]CTQ91170.1 sodium/calcium exchanger family protein [Kibdelosporangium sp. MJ126-NF4]